MKLAAVVLAAAVSLPVPAQTTLIEEGRAALDRDDPGTAATVLQKAVQQFPDNADAHAFLGMAYGTLAQRVNLFRRASLAVKTRNEFEKAVQLDPRQREARIGLLEYYALAPGFAGGSIEKAKQQAEVIRSLDLIGGHRAYAFIYAHLNQTGLARKEFLDAIAEQPRSADAHYWLGCFYATTDKNYAAAADEFETAVKLDPSHMPAWFEIGRMAALTGNDLDRGENALHTYMSRRPKRDDPPIERAQYWLRRIYEKQEMSAQARGSR